MESASAPPTPTPAEATQRLPPTTPPAAQAQMATTATTTEQPSAGLLDATTATSSSSSSSSSINIPQNIKRLIDKHIATVWMDKQQGPRKCDGDALMKDLEAFAQSSPALVLPDEPPICFTEPPSGTACVVVLCQYAKSDKHARFWKNGSSTAWSGAVVRTTYSPHSGIISNYRKVVFSWTHPEEHISSLRRMKLVVVFLPDQAGRDLLLQCRSSSLPIRIISNLTPSSPPVVPQVTQLLTASNDPPVAPSVGGGDSDGVGVGVGVESIQSQVSHSRESAISYLPLPSVPSAASGAASSSSSSASSPSSKGRSSRRRSRSGGVVSRPRSPPTPLTSTQQLMMTTPSLAVSTATVGEGIGLLAPDQVLVAPPLQVSQMSFSSPTTSSNVNKRPIMEAYSTDSVPPSLLLGAAISKQPKLGGMLWAGGGGNTPTTTTGLSPSSSSPSATTSAISQLPAGAPAPPLPSPPPAPVGSDSETDGDDNNGGRSRRSRYVRPEDYSSDEEQARSRRSSQPTPSLQQQQPQTFQEAPLPKYTSLLAPSLGSYPVQAPIVAPPLRLPILLPPPPPIN